MLLWKIAESKLCSLRRLHKVKGDFWEIAERAKCYFGRLQKVNCATLGDCRKGIVLLWEIAEIKLCSFGRLQKRKSEKEEWQV